jgi:hypothetical protein
MKLHPRFLNPGRATQKTYAGQCQRKQPQTRLKGKQTNRYQQEIQDAARRTTIITPTRRPTLGKKPTNKNNKQKTAEIQRMTRNEQRNKNQKRTNVGKQASSPKKVAKKQKKTGCKMRTARTHERTGDLDSAKK